MTYNNEVEARRVQVTGHNFTIHHLVSLACEYAMIETRQQFYSMTARMQAAILKQMTPYAIEIFG